MNKNTLFELIRREEVVLWAGAGLSMYAGFPNGKELIDILLKSVPEDYRQDLDATKPLPQFVEDYVRLQRGNVNSLVRVLNRIYSKNPKSNETHKILASIPHIKNIITTNYDNLFEQAYGDKLHKVVNSLNLMYLDKEKVTLFKVHGDLQDSESILISARDYRDFFVEKKSRILWKYIENLLATKTVVFIGYTLDDINVLSMYEQLKKEFKGHMSQAYLVSPSISRLKQIELEQNGIVYIQATGEQFFAELLQNINDNILHDVEMGHTSADTFKRFMNSHDLKANLANLDGGFKVSHLTKSNGTAKAKLRLNLDDNPLLRSKFVELMNGFAVEPLTFSNEDLKGAEVRIENLKLPMNENAEYRLVLSPEPMHDAFYDLFFDGFEVRKINIKAFRGANSLKVVIRFYTASIEVDIRFVENDMLGTLSVENTVNDDNCVASSTKEQIEIYRLVQGIGSGRPIKYYSYENEKSGSINPIATVEEDLSKYIEYFEKLQVIEKAFDIRFSFFKDINNSVKDVDSLYKALIGTVEEIKWTGNVPLKGYSALEINSLEDPESGAAKGMILREIQSADLLILGKQIKVTLTRSFQFVKPIVVRENDGGAHLKSENDMYIVTHSYGEYNERAG